MSKVQKKITIEKEIFSILETIQNLIVTAWVDPKIPRGVIDQVVSLFKSSLDFCIQETHPTRTQKMIYETLRKREIEKLK